MKTSQPALCMWMLGMLFAAGAAGARDGAAADGHWVASWGAAQQIPEPNNELPAAQWRDASLRQVVHMSLGGSRLRVRISNAFGSAPLLVSGASVAKARAPGSADIDPSSLRPLTFDGHASVTIPAGAEYYSDPVALDLAATSDLAVSMYFRGEPARQTGHPGARATSYTVKGDHVRDASWPDAAKVEHWYQLADIEVQAPRRVGAVVAIGDSITDGHGATTNGNDRWTDFLARRLAQDGRAGAMGVVNAGIGGGRMLLDGLGPNLAARFDRDVLSRSGVTHAIVLIGVNDLGSLHRNTDDLPEARLQMVDELHIAYRQLADRAHAHGVCLVGATITPYAGSDYYHPNAANEADRQAVNSWIRSSGVFDAIADFDAAIRDPAQPQRLGKDYDSGDGLHPGPAGYRAMADAVPLALLRHCAAAR